MADFCCQHPFLVYCRKWRLMRKAEGRGLHVRMKCRKLIGNTEEYNDSR